MGFGDRLKMVRKELGLTQQEMADRMRIKRSCLANYETDRNFPIDAVIGLICQEYNWPISCQFGKIAKCR